MLTLGLTGRIWLCTSPVDGRKSFDGLSAIVQTGLERDPLSGDLFVFRNKRGDRLKILAWQGDGFALYLRRLERGTFAFPASTTASRGEHHRHRVGHDPRRHRVWAMLAAEHASSNPLNVCSLADAFLLLSFPSCRTHRPSPPPTRKAPTRASPAPQRRTA